MIKDREIEFDRIMAPFRTMSDAQSVQIGAFLRGALGSAALRDGACSEFARDLLDSALDSLAGMGKEAVQ